MVLSVCAALLSVCQPCDKLVHLALKCVRNQVLRGYCRAFLESLSLSLQACKAATLLSPVMANSVIGLAQLTTTL